MQSEGRKDSLLSLSGATSSSGMTKDMDGMSFFDLAVTAIFYMAIFV